MREKVGERKLREEGKMWTCPQCGREFQRTNQGHFCGKAPETVSEYINSQPAEYRDRLTEIARILHSSVPGINERILWSMPYYEKEGKCVSFSACKNHISFYAGAEAIERFSVELRDFATKKNAIYLPYDRALPVKLIESITEWRLS